MTETVDNWQLDLEFDEDVDFEVPTVNGIK